MGHWVPLLSWFFKLQKAARAHLLAACQGYHLACFFLVVDPCFHFHWLFDPQAAPVTCCLPQTLLALVTCLSLNSDIDL